MNVILENNSFTMDTREARLTRLMLLKDNIEEYAPEISLELSNLEWAAKAADEFKTLLEQQSKIFQEKNSIFRESNEAENDLYNRYIAIKELILSKTDKNSKIRKSLDMEGAFPSNKQMRFEIAQKTIKFVKDNPNELTEMNLPFLLFENLENLNLNASELYKKAIQTKKLATEITDKLNTKFDEDSAKLRELYNWIVAFWSKKDPKLNFLGFTQPVSVARSSNTPEAITGLSIKENFITWNPVENCEKYQVGWRIQEDGQDFKEIYFGNERKCRLVRKGEYIIRGFNQYGFGEWSNKLNLT